RDHGKIPLNYPFEHFFNDLVAIVKINGKFLLTDATEDLSQYDRIPYRCINEKGLMVVKNTDPWVKLNQNLISIQQETLKLQLLPDVDSVAGNISRQMTEYIALNYKNAYRNKEEDIEKALIKEGFYQISDLSTDNYNNTNAPYQISFNTKMPIEKFENSVFIKPFLSLPIDDNILKQETRIYPVDMVYQNRRIFKSEIEIPTAYSVTKLPQNYNFEDDLVQIIFSTKEVDGVIKTQGSYFFKKAVYEATEYGRLKTHFDNLVKVFNEKIVLSKKG
ncbi:MAG TPA: hypothetical protein VFM79_03420, partial [Pelobium sp.]|nr:hypothetical protein [Pelobium sp.]